MSIDPTELTFELESTVPKGGQHVGTNHYVMIGTHKPTGITIRIPPDLTRSQHKQRTMIVEAMEWILHSARWVQ